jgi:hypothetical protein
MRLVDDIIYGTIYEEKLKEFNLKRGITEDRKSGLLVGKAWYEGFLKRNGKTLTRKQIKLRDSKRRTWCTTFNFERMYECVYNALVECGIAEQLEHEVMLDRDGNIVDYPKLMFGRPSKYRMLKLERCLFVDETGCNTNQKTDGYIGGEKFVVSVDQTELGRNGVFTNLNFTVLPFFSGTGDAVMCAVILKSDKSVADLPIKWRRGIDIARYRTKKESNVELFEDSLSENGLMQGGQRCRYNGIDIPCFVCSSAKSSITTELLVEMLKFIDDNGVFPRSCPNNTPFLLLNGHQSRTKLEFLEYINDNGHRWKCCIGVPYATHIWEPADSSELRSSYKIAVTKAKALYQRSKQDNKKSFKPTNVIPLLNLAWADSFGRKELARKAILERGWLVLNYVLLDDDWLPNDTNNVEKGQCFVDDKNSRKEREINLERIRNMLRSIN